MAASEHTPHMRLSQFGPDDRPSWIDDYNADMRIIDTALTQGGSQAEPLFCTAQVGYGSNFTTSAKTPYTVAFTTHEGNIAVDYNTHTIPITKSGYYAISGYADVGGVTCDPVGDKSLLLEIKYSENESTGNSSIFIFTKSYEPSDSGTPDYGMGQSCSITPVIVHLNAGDAVTIMIVPAANSTTAHGFIATMYLTVESKTFDSDAN